MTRQLLEMSVLELDCAFMKCRNSYIFLVICGNSAMGIVIYKEYVNNFKKGVHSYIRC